jgi:hypothetical protein
MNAAKSVTATFTQAPMAKNITKSTDHATLTAAIASADPNDVIHTLDTQLDGAVTINKAINLIGGWNATYLGKSGLPTTLNGILTILNGDSTAETVVVKGKIAVQGGSLRVKDVKVIP